MNPNTIDWNSRTYYCGYCNCPRSINDVLNAAPCEECGDPEKFLGELGDPFADAASEEVSLTQ